MARFQQLTVYRQAIAFAATAVRVASALPRGYAPLGDQLRRAAFSVPLNIAEASGRTSKADAARHFAIARGSAMECSASLDVIHLLGTLDDETYAAGARQLDGIVAMLTRLCRVAVAFEV